MDNTIVCVGRYKKNVKELENKALVPRGGKYNYYVLQDSNAKRIVVTESKLRELMSQYNLNISNIYIDDTNRIILREQKEDTLSIENGAVYLDEEVLNKIDSFIEEIYTNPETDTIISGGNTNLTLKFKQVKDPDSYVIKMRLLGASVYKLKLGAYTDLRILKLREGLEIVTKGGFLAPEEVDGIITLNMCKVGFETYDLSMIDFSHTKKLSSFVEIRVKSRSLKLIQNIILPKSINKAKLTELHSILFRVRNIENIEYIDTSNVNNISNLCMSDGFNPYKDNLFKKCIETWDLHNVKYARSAFTNLNLDKLDLNKAKMDMSKVVDASGMFTDSTIESLILNENFDNLDDASYMFIRCKIGNIYNTSGEKAKLRFKKCSCMSSAFYNAKFDELNISELNIIKGKYNTANASAIFRQAVIGRLKLGDINIYGDVNICNIFENTVNIADEDTLIRINIHKAEKVWAWNSFLHTKIPKLSVELNFIDQKFNKKYLKLDETQPMFTLPLNVRLENTFEGTIFNSIKITQNNNVPFLVRMESPFWGVVALEIDMHTMRFENLTYAWRAFSGLNVGKLDLSGTRTYRLETANKIFDSSVINELVLGDWSRHNITARDRKFKYYSGNSLIKHKQGLWINGDELSKDS